MTRGFDPAGERLPDRDTVTSPEETSPENLSFSVSKESETADGSGAPPSPEAGSGATSQDKTREAEDWTSPSGAGLHPTRQAPVATAAAVDLQNFLEGLRRGGDSR